jgi:UPF0716 family protein affecting phage T7 exclusion
MQRAITLLGWVLIALSPLPWLAIMTLPFLGMSLEAGAVWAVALVVLSEILFFAGAVIIGPQLYRNRKAILDKLRGSRSPPDRAPDDATG